MAASWGLLSLVGLVVVARWLLYTLWDALVGFRALFLSRLSDPHLAHTYGGKWAVVTGASDGIGKEYVRQLARRGMNVVLVSRTLEKMTKIAQEIEKECGVESDIIQVDFSEGRQVYPQIAKRLEGRDIAILVNNVGVCHYPPTKFINVSDDDIWGHVNVNVASAPAMCKIVLPQMLERNNGAIINVASMASTKPAPGFSVYCPTKAFVDYFSQTLEWELRGSGVVVQTVRPALVSTNMTSFSDYTHTPSPTTHTAETYVASAINTLGYTRRTAGTVSHGLQTHVAEHFVNKWVYMYLFEKWNTMVEEDYRKKQ